MDRMYCLGVDVGGTKIETRVFALNKLGELRWNKDIGLETLSVERISTERDKGLESILHRFFQCVESAVSHANLRIDQIESFGVGLPGSVDPRSHKMIKGNSMVLVNCDFEKEIRNHFSYKKSIFFENDANCFSLAEFISGVGRIQRESERYKMESQTALGVILGTGLGGGLIVNGRMISGRRGTAGEIGHNQLIENGFNCYCGKRGCGEQYLSGPAFEASFDFKKHSQLKKPIKAQKIFELAMGGDSLAMSCVENYKTHLARFLAELNNILDLDYIVLGGGMSREDLLYTDFGKYMKKYSFIESSLPQVFKNSLGDSAGSIGAAMLGVLEKGVIH